MKISCKSKKLNFIIRIYCTNQICDLTIHVVQWLHAISIPISSPCPSQRNKGIGFGPFYCGHTH